MTSTLIEVPSKAELQAQSAPVLREAHALAVVDVASHGVGLNLLKNLTAAEKVVRAKLDPIVSTAHNTHSALTSLRKELVDPIVAAKVVVNGKLTTYEEAAKRAAAEEAQRMAEAERKAEENRRLTAAVEAEASGDRLTAEAIMNEEPAEIVVTVQPEMATIAGVGRTYDVWSAEVFDIVALVKHGKAEFLLPNQTALNALAKAFRNNMGIPGVRAVCKTARAVRG